jgi:curved DNA-binding protein
VLDKELRRHKRHALNCALTLSWENAAGEASFYHARGLDISDSGIRVESPEPVALSSHVYVRAEEYGVMGGASVRYCSRRGEKYILGLEFAASEARSCPNRKNGFVDYYEVLQVSPNAEMETIHRVFKILAARYHPDNPQTGDKEQFLLLAQAYEALSDPERRAAYDSTYRLKNVEGPMPVFEAKEFFLGVEAEANRRLGILSLLYQRRRLQPDHPGLSLLEFEKMMLFPRELLSFTVWFLKDKKYIEMLHNSDYAITSTGVEFLETRLPSNPILSKLLQAGRSDARGTNEPGDATSLS